MLGISLRGSKLKWLERVPDRERRTLVPIIEKRIAPQSEVSTDGWAGYHNLEQYLQISRHLVVNHKKEYVNKETGANTQQIESSWRHCKIFLPDIGVREEYLDGYLGHYMWDRWVAEYGKAPFIFFLQCMTEMYPPCLSQFRGVIEI